jgi:hypothetical protein
MTPRYHAEQTRLEDPRMPEARSTLTIESISAFNGLDVLVARDEGLFSAEGLDVVIARPRSGERRLSGARDRGTLLQPASNQGQLLDQHAADLFQG